MFPINFGTKANGGCVKDSRGNASDFKMLRKKALFYLWPAKERPVGCCIGSWLHFAFIVNSDDE